MEFNIEVDRIIGAIDQKRGEDSARIKVLALLKDGKKLTCLSDNEIQKLFPPKGYIFEPSFFHNFHQYSENDFISCFIDINEKAEPGYDTYRIKVASGIRAYGINVRKINGFKKSNLATDLSNIVTDKDISDGKFYGITDKYIIGELRMKNGKLEPALHHRIKFWDIDESNLLTHKNIIKLHHVPNGEYKPLDCMDDRQLFEWFRENLRKVDSDYVKLLDENSKWRVQIPELFSKTDPENLEVDHIRLDRIKGKIESIRFSSLEIKEFLDKSEILRGAFVEEIARHKEEFKQEYETELEEYNKEINTKKQELNSELIVLKNKKNELGTEIDSLHSKVKELNTKLETIDKNKERIIGDFSIIKEILSINNNVSEVRKFSDTYVLEYMERPIKESIISNKNDFIIKLKNQLCKFNLNPNISNLLTDVVSLYDAIFIKDLRIGLSFVEATDSASYIIQNVGPDWLHFHDFWNNGLGEIWETARNNPDRLHFLFIEDINLSSPECYAKPLLDVIIGIRNRIPIGKSSFPKNLKIFSTKASTEDPEIGLPLIKQTFNGWGAIGYSVNIYKENQSILEHVKGYIDVHSLQHFKPDDAECELIRSRVKAELDHLFE